MALKPKAPMSADNALTRLRDLCDRAEYCTSELLAKMRTWGIPPAQASHIITILRSERRLDDARYSRATAYTKSAYNHWGKLKISLYLRSKKIPDNLIAEALDEIDYTHYLNNLREVIAAKRRQLGAEADTYEGRTKIFRFAASKGFEPSLIADMLRGRISSSVD